MNILVTGGCGYVGSVLCMQLVALGHRVRVLDLQWFGDGYLSRDNGSLEVIRGDIRDPHAVRRACQGMDAVLHLACVSNDHSCQLDEALSTSINLHAFEPLVIAAKAAGVRRFIYCSSSSVYGVSDADNVTETHPLVPLTLYNRYKGECEPLLLRHQDDGFTCAILRPATVCGPAPRMRFDLTVNILTAHAILNRRMTVFGGEQRRPNLHLRDMVRAYVAMLDAPADKIAGQIFNIGRQNMKVSEIAELVRRVVRDEMQIDAAIETTDSTDKRSYHIDASKIERVLGFKPLFSVGDAVRDICIKFGEGQWQDALTNPVYTNVKQLVDQGHAVRDSLAPYRKDRYA
jgi:nucleoside-diphosphate-sugar epimerase